MNFMGKRTNIVKVSFDDAQFADLARMALSRDKTLPEMLYSIAMDRLYGERRLFSNGNGGQFGPLTSQFGHDEDD